MAIEGPLRELGIHDVFQLLDLSRKTGVLRVTSDLRNNAGTISFEDGAIVYAEIRSNPHPLGSLLLRTGRVNDADLERARDMQVRGGVPAFAPAQAGSEGDLDLLPPEWEVLALIDGQRDVRAVAAALGRSDFDVAKTLFGLESAGLVVLTDPGTQPGAHGESGGGPAEAGGPAAAAGGAAVLVPQAEEALRPPDRGPARAG